VVEAIEIGTQTLTYSPQRRPNPPSPLKTKYLEVPSWTLLNSSPTLGVSDSIPVDESEMIPCEVSLDFSMSMIA
jgi:hypothetical protein